jgi:hypothetical protein
MRLGLFGEVEEPVGVLPGVLADGLQHPEAVFPTKDKALFDQGLQGVQVGVGHLLGGLKGGSSSEDTQVGEQGLLICSEQLVGPLDGGPQGLLASLGVSSPPQ